MKCLFFGTFSLSLTFKYDFHINDERMIEREKCLEIFKILILLHVNSFVDFVCLVWFFTSQSTDMVMLEWSVHLTTFFPD